MTTRLTETEKGIEFPSGAMRIVFDKVTFNQSLPPVDLIVSLPYGKRKFQNELKDTDSEAGTVDCSIDFFTRSTNECILKDWTSLGKVEHLSMRINQHSPSGKTALLDSLEGDLEYHFE